MYCRRRPGYAIMRTMWVTCTFVSLGLCLYMTIGFEMRGGVTTSRAGPRFVLRASAGDTAGSAEVSRRDMLKHVGSAISSAAAGGEDQGYLFTVRVSSRSTLSKTSSREYLCGELRPADLTCSLFNRQGLSADLTDIKGSSAPTVVFPHAVGLAYCSCSGYTMGV